MGKKRVVAINRVKRWSRSIKGKQIIGRLAPDVLNKMNNNPDILDIPQYENRADTAGNYVVYVNGEVYYTGEGGNLYIRIAEHIYNLHKTDNFGFTLPDKNINVRFEIDSIGIISKADREAREAELIDELHPVIQYTSIDAPEYGSDKLQYEYDYITCEYIRVDRELIRPDYCVTKELRRERLEKLLKKSA